MALPLRALTPAADSSATGVILAIDYGKKRLGLALSDELRVTCRPSATWARINRRRDLARLREFARENKVRLIVVGCPLHMDGTASEMSEEARSFATRVRKALGLPVEMMDERLSSWEARAMVVAEATGKRISRGTSAAAAPPRKPPVDDVAAAIILRDYLNLSQAEPRT